MANKKRYQTAPLGSPLGDLHREFKEREHALILGTLSKHGGNKQQAATDLGLNRTTLIEWLRRNYPEMLQEASR